MGDIHSLLKEREVSHGRFAHNADAWDGLCTLFNHHCVGLLSTRQQLALSLIFLKLARISQNPDNADNWRDIAGYAQLIVNDLETSCSTR